MIEPPPPPTHPPTHTKNTKKKLVTLPIDYIYVSYFFGSQKYILSTIYVCAHNLAFVVPFILVVMRLSLSSHRIPTASGLAV